MVKTQSRSTDKRRSRLPRAQRTSDILRAAEEVLEQSGYENAAVAEVARRAGVVEGTVYHYFETKRDLYVAVAEGWYKRVLDGMAPATRRGGVRAALREVIHRELLIIRASPAVVRFILMEVRPHPDYRHSRLFAMSREFTSEITRILTDGMASGELAEHLPMREARDMIFGGIEHRTWAFLRDEGDFDAERAADAISHIVYNGLRNTSEGAAGEGHDALPERVARLERVVALLGEAKA
ncbi:MAG: TetR family transcriptional regulator [Novosphingobium sp.]|nr:TetR family transcriptional regulator [Novosphingobium sp.]MCP5389870.1 TetR family transcriptional regulator [Novosphingobium sp.]